MINSLISGIKKKDKVSLSKSITVVENRIKGYKDILRQTFNLNNNSLKIGITGPPGAGKSTIVNEIAKIYTKNNKSVGIICVDPSSPFNGGSILGDRIRLNDLYSKNVFIRSISTRGELGGLFSSVSDIDTLYSAFDFDVIIYETVGVGQAEMDIMNYSNTVLLVITPESGDDIQMMKSGLLECADIITINKSDRPGALRLNATLDKLKFSKNGWDVPTVRTVGLNGEGFETLINQISKHSGFLSDNNIFEKINYQKYLKQVKDIASEKMLANFFNLKRMSAIDREISKPLKDRLSPQDLFEKIK